MVPKRLYGARWQRYRPPAITGLGYLESEPCLRFLEAALNPADGPWLWYVLSSPDGHHTFTDDYDEFLELKADCAAQGLGCSA